MTAPTSTQSTAPLSFGQLQTLWINAGGAADKAPIAAAVAIAESGGRAIRSAPNNNGTVDVGYWQINTVHGAQATLDPMGNARAAIQISANGTNWKPWCTAWSTGKCSGTYDPTGGSPVGRALAANAGQTGELISTGSPISSTVSGNPLSPDFWTHVIDVLGNWMFYLSIVAVGGVFMFLGTFQLARETPVGRAMVSGASKAVQLLPFL